MLLQEMGFQGHHYIHDDIKWKHFLRYFPFVTCLLWLFWYFKDQGIFENGLGEIREFYSGTGGIP